MQLRQSGAHKQEELMLNAIFLTLVLALQTAAFGQDNAQVYASGHLGFHYDQVFGDFDGDFFAEGEVDTSTWVPDELMGVGGFLSAADSTGSQTLFTLAGELDAEADSTWNVFGIFHRSPTPLQVGSVQNPTQSVYCFFLWHVDSLAIPEELPDSLDAQDMLEELFGSLSAEHKLIGAATSLNITRLDDEGLDCQFSATLVDMDNYTFIVNLSGGSGEFLALDDVTLEPARTVPEVFALHCYPNPFNPSVTLSFNLDLGGESRLLVYDMLGRRVVTRNLGPLSAGSHDVVWDAGGHASSVYLMQLEVKGLVLAQQRVTLLK
jgi:hypothetical protein